MFTNMDNSFTSDNPYYFYNEKPPRTPDSQTSSKGFSIFKRRNSKGNSPRVTIPEKTRSINSGNLDTAATMTLGSPRGSFGSLGSYPGVACAQHSMEMNSSNDGGGNSSSIFRRSRAPRCRERLGSYNETSLITNENEDIFQASPQSKNHHTLPSMGIRRHSFGNFHQRGTSERLHQKGAPPSSPDEAPNMVAPKPPVFSPNKYRGSTKRKDNCGSGSSFNSTTTACASNMDDILIITAKHSERSILRANFLKNHFDKITKQRGRKPFNFLHIKIEDGPFTEEVAKKYNDTALQIVILCPALLALSHSYLMTQLSSILRFDKVLGILLDVTEEKVLEIHKSALPSYRKWRRCVLRDNDQTELSNILGVATDILGRALCQRPPCPAEINTNQSKGTSGYSEGFTVMPRKVKIGQNKVVAMLAEPLEKDDILKIIVEKSGELIEVRNFKHRNPYTLQFSIPETCMEISTMIEIRIEKNDKNLGSRPIKCESRMRELEQLLRSEDSPIEFMCLSLGVGSNDRDALDSHLLQCFQKNMPPNFHLLSGSFEKQNHFFTIRESRPEEYPTLLHFAARWGFDRLSMQLMECPGGDTACGIRNCTGKTPAELAEQEGFHKLAQSINSFSEFHELTTMYHYFKGANSSGSGVGVGASGGVGASSSNTSASTANGKITTKAIIEPVRFPPSSRNCASPKNRPVANENVQPKANESSKLLPKKDQTDDADYMEMSSGSEHENSPNTPLLAVSNLNYVSVEMDDENLQGSNGEIEKNFETMKIIADGEVTSKELRISEPPYYQSNENNKKLVNMNATSPYQTDQFSQECSHLLESCDSSSMHYVLQPSNIPVNAICTTKKDDYDSGDYQFQPSNRPVEWASREFMPSRCNLNRMMSNSRLAGIGNGTLKRSGSDASSTRGNAEDELVEIMNDFKNNVLSIRDVEQLVDKWKHRNDVKQSFREKQEHIEVLRKEYERIQEQVRSHLKRETPFEKFKKLFSRHKAPTDQSIADGIEKINDSCNDETKLSMKSIGQRPISSLSLQSVSSSTSSGRLSTGSACSGTSLGDSGTHSDHEDRRFVAACRIGSPGSLMDNYMVPPPPRPVHTPSSTPGEERERLLYPSSVSPNYNQRANTPSSPACNEHYLMFPSNLPSNDSLYQSQSISSSSSHSNGFLNTIPESAKESTNGHDYQQIDNINDKINDDCTFIDIEPNLSSGVTVQPIKIQDRSNIIYGRLTKGISAATQMCTSFKPQPQPQQQNRQIVVAEVYQNIAANLDKPIDVKDATKENNCPIEGDHHNYINV